MRFKSPRRIETSIGKTFLLILLLALLVMLLVGAVGFVVVVSASVSSSVSSSASGAAPSLTSLPTLAVLPSVTPTQKVLAQAPLWLPSVTPLPASPTASATATPSPSPTPSPTATLSVRLLEIHAIMPGVVVPPTTTPLPPHLRVLAEPPPIFEPLPDATHEPPPYSGWTSFESDHPWVRYSTRWQPRQIAAASRGQYHRTEDVTSFVTFPFEGEAVRVRYVAARNMGTFEVIVDGILLDRVDAYAPELHFPGTRPYIVGPGAHVLTLRSAGTRNPASEGYVVGLDAIQVYRSDANVLLQTPVANPATPTPLPQPALRVEQIAAPDAVTPSPPRRLNVAVLIAYDENANRAVDPAEGVSGVPVRLVAASTNQPLAEAFTDARGYARLQIVTPEDVRVVVPYFSTVWDVAQGRDGEARFTLLLEAGNQPGLIP